MRILHDLLGSRRLGLTPALLGLLLAATGLVIWTGLSLLSGSDEAGTRLQEPWDTSAYLYFGLPVMALAVALAAFLFPERAWRWPLCVVAGHQAGVLIVGAGMQSGLSLLLLTLILAVLLAALFLLPALLGILAARHLAARAF